MRPRRRSPQLSGGVVRLIWAATENLGDWAVVRKRLNEQLQAQAQCAAGAESAPAHSNPRPPFFPPTPTSISQRNWARRCGRLRPSAGLPSSPARSSPDAGKHTWNLTSNLSPDGIMLARHAAPSDDGKSAAPVQTLARRAQGRSIWGVLRGDVDNFGAAAAPRHQHRGARAALRALQAVFRRRTGSAVLAAGVLAQGDASSIRAATTSPSTALGRADRRWRAKCSGCSIASRKRT